MNVSQNSDLKQPERIGKPTKEKIFDTAIDLFSSNGFSGVSIRDITRAVGIKESSFYNHYSSKDELINALFEYVKIAFVSMMPPVERLEKILLEMTPAEFLVRGNEIFLQRMITPRFKKIWQILFIEQYHDPRARALILQELVERPLADTEAAFRTMLQLGVIKPLDPRVLAAEYLFPIAFMSSPLLLDAGESNPEAFEKRLSEHVEFFLNIIKKEEK